MRPASKRLIASRRRNTIAATSARAELPSSASAAMRCGAWRSASSATMPPIEQPISTSAPRVSASSCAAISGRLAARVCTSLTCTRAAP
jgi:hypothetical protein